VPSPHPIELRERAVHSYIASGESYDEVAARFGIARRALQRWVKLHRETDSVAPRPRGGGNPSQVNMPVLEGIIAARQDATSFELTAQYNRLVTRDERVHRSSIHRALHRAGYVFKKKSYVPPSRSAPTCSKSESDSSAD
jgi:transposase